MAPNIIENKILTKSSLIFYVNGKKIVDNNPDPECTLLTYLRENLRLCGTKLGCGEGGCGACTVMLSKFDREKNIVKHIAVNACLQPVCGVHGCAIVTIEGIGNTKNKLHPVQERIAKAHGSQCGFCTPGIVMSMYSLLRNSPKPTLKEMEITFQGNLCRCTGYRPIIEGYRTFTIDYKCPMGEKCCQNNGGSGFDDGNVAAISTDINHNDNNNAVDKLLFKPNEFIPYDPTQEPIFPPELKLSDTYDRESLVFYGNENVTWYRPTSLNELLTLKLEFPNGKIIIGNSEIGVEVKFKKLQYSTLIMGNQIAELNAIEICENGVKFGSSVTLDDIDKTLNGLIETLPKYKTKIFQSIIDMLNYFAGKQIRNVASVGGNIMTGSPISDLIPIFTAAEIELEVESLTKGIRKIKMGNNFFIGYRKNVIEPFEVLKTIFIPITKKNQYFIAYKQAKRQDDDIAIVNFALDITFVPNTDVIENINLAFGGMAPTVVMAPNTAAKIIGKHWNHEIIEIVNKELSNELPMLPNAPGGMIHYRRSLTLSLFFKSYLSIKQSLADDKIQQISVSNVDRSGADVFHPLEPKSSQFYEYQVNSDKIDAVGKPNVHLSAYKQVSGEASYCDDMPKYKNELYLSFVLSTRAHAKIISIDSKAAEQLAGVHMFLTAKDLNSEQNKIGPVFHDEELFVSDTVTAHGQTIGVIIADNQKIAQRAASMVKITYEDILPIIITIDDAIRQQSFYPGNRSIVKGNVERAFEESSYIVEGDCRTGAQEHFYLETHAAIAVPRDTDELEIFCSVQHPTEIQKLTSHITGLSASKIVARVKRMGGGFGGKESRGMLIALPVALAAHRLGRPVRCMLDRDEDMMMTGTRHPFYIKYKAGCNKEGKLIACDVQIYCNAGYSIDLSYSILERAMFHFENSYFIPNIRVKGWACRTNLPSNTAFRGFGGPQGMFAAEHIIRDVARVLGRDYIEIAKSNLYCEGQLTHYNQELINCHLTRCWDECYKKSEYMKRKAAIEQFNKQNRWRKRGISMVPTKFGIAFTATFLNQAGALIHVYSDGSVLLSHGGTEMGQGLHTKMIQVASRALDLPPEKIHVSETATDKVPNTSATAASAGSDLNGMAVLNACNILMERIKPYKEKYPHEGWNSWINKAYFDRVSLSATGFYATPNIGYNFETNSGNPFNYFTYGAAVSEVEIDCLTGAHQVIRTDIVMDLGTSINPAIDIGQIEGGFTQGYGLFTLEEMIYSSNGALLSKGPGMYKIPGFSDIPGEFNVSLLKGVSNPRAVYSSKAVGEPPLFLAASIFFAIKEAISSARKDENLTNDFKLIAPATAERIRMACEDKFTKQFQMPPPETYTPWNVVP